MLLFSQTLSKLTFQWSCSASVERPGLLESCIWNCAWDQIHLDSLSFFFFFMAQGSRLVWWKSRRIEGEEDRLWHRVTSFQGTNEPTQWNPSWTEVHHRHTDRLASSSVSSTAGRRLTADYLVVTSLFLTCRMLCSYFFFVCHSRNNSYFCSASQIPSQPFTSLSWKYNLSPRWVNKSPIKTCR